MIGAAESRLSQSSPLAHRYVLPAVLRDSILRLTVLNYLPDVLQYHVVGADFLGGEEALSLVRGILSFRQEERKAAETGRVDRRRFRET